MSQKNFSFFLRSLLTSRESSEYKFEFKNNAVFMKKQQNSHTDRFQLSTDSVMFAAFRTVWFKREILLTFFQVVNKL